MEEGHPGGVVLGIETVGVRGLHDEEEGLGESEEEDDVDDGEGEHVAGDHLEDHGHKGPGQLDRSTEEHEVEPGIKVCQVTKTMRKLNQLPGIAKISMDSSMLR